MDTTQNAVANLATHNVNVTLPASRSNGKPGKAKAGKPASKGKGKAEKPANTLYAKVCAIALKQTLSGSVKSEFDSKTSFGLAYGVPSVGPLLRNRERILQRASVFLKGFHTPKGVGHIEFAKSILAAINDMTDAEEKKLCLVGWRQCALLFAAHRTVNGEFGVEFAKA